MSITTPGLQTYNSAFPFDVAIQNQYKGELLPLIYIVDNSNTTPGLKEINICITPTGDENFKLGGFSFEAPANVATYSPSIPALAPSNASFTPGSQQFNLALAIRPGVLNNQIIPNISKQLYKALQNTLDQENACCVYGPVTRPSDNALVWYCALKEDMVLPSDGLTLKLTDISANPGVGSRNSQIECILGNIFVNGGNSPFSFKRSVHIDIINHQGIAAAPLYFTVLGQNTLLNNSTKGQDLKVYFETIGKQPVQFGPDTKFTFHFSCGDSDSNEMYFGEQRNVAGIVWNEQNSVIPYNSSNETLPPNSTANPNFTDQYTSTPDGPEVSESIVTFSQTFEHKTNQNTTNPLYTSLKDQVLQYENVIDQSKGFYTGDSGPKGAAEELIKAKKDTFDWANESLIPDFSDKIKEIVTPYLPLLMKIQSNFPEVHKYSTQSGQANIGYYNDMLSKCTLDVNQSITTQEWDTNYSYLFVNYVPEGVIRGYTDMLNGPDFYNSIPGRVAQNDYSTGNALVAPNRWADQNFAQFVVNQFSPLVKYISAQYPSGQDFFAGTETKVFPSRALYDFFFDVYTAYLVPKIDQYISSTLLDCSQGFTKDQWQTSFQQVQQNFSTQQATSLTTDATEVTSQFNDTVPWANDDFFSYVQNNLSQLVDGLTINTSFIVPSASLFDYFFASYQHSVTSQSLNTMQPTIPFYINPTSCVFHFKNLQLSGDDGLVLLHIKVENLPGYWDTDFQVPIIKAASLLHAQLDLSGANGANSRSGTNGSSRINFLSAGNTNPQGDTPQVSLEEDWGLNIYGEPAQPPVASTNPPSQSGTTGFPGRPVKIRDADLLIPEGRLSINGGNNATGLPVYPDSESANPNEKLNVGGDTTLKGNLTVEEDTKLKGSLTVDEQSTFNKNAVFNNGSQSGAALALAYNAGTNTQSILIGKASDLGSNWGPLCIALPQGAGNWPIVVTQEGNPLFTVDINGNVVTKGGRYTDKTGDVMPVGSIIAFGGSTAPDGWLLCDGKTNITQQSHPDLWTVLGGQGTYTTPNLGGRTLIGTGKPTMGKQTDGTTPNFDPNNNWPLGYTGGEYKHKLTEAEMPSHNHGYTYENPLGGNTSDYYSGSYWSPSTVNATTDNTGSDTPHNTMQPYYAVNYIIKY